MTQTKIEIRNLGCIEDVSICVDKPLALFYGDVRAGKTTILNAVRLLLGGAFPDDLIRHGAQEASAQLEVNSDTQKVCLRREWYRGKDGDIKARPIAFIRDGKPVTGKVVEAIRELVNPFLLNQNHLVDMRAPERQAYLQEVLNVDTQSFDVQIQATETQASELRKQIKAMGVITPVPVDLVDEDELRKQREARLNAGAVQQQKHQQALGEQQIRKNARTAAQQNISGFGSQLADNDHHIQEAEEQIKALQTRIAALRFKVTEIQDRRTNAELWLSQNPELETPLAPPAVDTSDIDALISDAKAQKVRFEIYQKEVDKQKTKARLETQLQDHESRLRQLRADKLLKLKEANAGCPVPGLRFSDTGDLVFEDTAESMLSDSQLMRLSALLSDLYPRGLGVELVDRAESLGTSVFAYVDRAQREDKTILATIVGERPADVPDHVGVYVVEAGKVTAV